MTPSEDKTPVGELDADERPTQPKFTETCPQCHGLGRIVEPAGPGRYRPTPCPECKGVQVVSIERYQELTRRL